MNLLMVISLLAVVLLSLLPTEIQGTKDVLGKQHHQLKASSRLRRDVWASDNDDEDEHQHVLRNKRAAKTNGPVDSVIGGVSTGPSSGKITGGSRAAGGKQRKNKKNKKPLENSREPISPSSIDASSTSTTTKPPKKSSKGQGSQDGPTSNKKQTVPRQKHQHDSNQKRKQLTSRQQLQHRVRDHSTKLAKTPNNNSNKENSKTLENEKLSQSCRYKKGPWGPCDQQTLVKQKTHDLIEGPDSCPKTKTTQKKCKQFCRYDKGAWSDCQNGQKTRIDKLKTVTGISSTCQQARTVNKECNRGKDKKEKKERKNKD